MATRKATPKPTRQDDRKRDRLALTPSPELRAALEELAQALGQPPATIAVQLLIEVIPQMQGLAKIARAAKAGNKAAAKRALVHMIGDAMGEIMAKQQPELFKK
jgi:phenylpyruvate tautomerase PptA (4-oxalocrotonate tautomerase family)